MVLTWHLWGLLTPQPFSTAGKCGGNFLTGTEVSYLELYQISRITSCLSQEIMRRLFMILYACTKRKWLGADP
jgi:hypothetical protein